MKHNTQADAVPAPAVDPRDLWFAEWQLTLPKDAREAWPGGQRTDGVAPSAPAQEVADALLAKQEQQRQTDDYQTGYHDALGDFVRALARDVAVPQTKQENRDA